MYPSRFIGGAASAELDVVKSITWLFQDFPGAVPLVRFGNIVDVCLPCMFILVGEGSNAVVIAFEFVGWVCIFLFQLGIFPFG